MPRSRSSHAQRLIALATAAKMLGITIHAFEVLRDQGRATIYRLHGKSKSVRLAALPEVRALRLHPRILARAVRAAD